MTAARNVGVALIVSMGVIGARNAASPTGREQDPVAQFRTSIESYGALHRRVVMTLGRPPVSAQPLAIVEAIDAIREAIRSKRASARPGDIFTREVATLIRSQIERALASYDNGEIPSFDDVDEDDTADTPSKLELNAPFPWRAGGGISAGLISVLPKVPEPLQYRFLRRDLALVDADADLVVDILREALPYHD